MRTIITVCTIASASVFALAVTPKAVTLLSQPVDGPDPRLVSADAAWVMHLDLEQALSTRLGRLLFDAGSRHLKFEEAESEGALGIDPIREIKRVTAYGFDAERGPGVLILEATPAIDLVIEKLRESHGEVTEEQVDGYQVLRWDEGVASIRGDGPTGRMVAFGPDDDTLLKALRVIDGQLPSLAGAAHSPLRRDVRAGSFFTMNVPDLAAMRDALEGAEDAPEILQVAQAFLLEVGEANDIAFLESAFATPSEEDSVDIAAVAQGLLAMGRLMLRDEPDLAALDPILRAMAIRAEGPSVRMTFEIPAAALPQPEAASEPEIETSAQDSEDDLSDG